MSSCFYMRKRAADCGRRYMVAWVSNPGHLFWQHLKLSQLLYPQNLQHWPDQTSVKYLPGGSGAEGSATQTLVQVEKKGCRRKEAGKNYFRGLMRKGGTCRVISNWKSVTNFGPQHFFLTFQTYLLQKKKHSKVNPHIAPSSLFTVGLSI